MDFQRFLDYIQKNQEMFGKMTAEQIGELAIAAGADRITVSQWVRAKVQTDDKRKVGEGP